MYIIYPRIKLEAHVNNVHMDSMKRPTPKDLDRFIEPGNHYVIIVFPKLRGTV